MIIGEKLGFILMSLRCIGGSLNYRKNEKLQKNKQFGCDTRIDGKQKQTGCSGWQGSWVELGNWLGRLVGWLRWVHSWLGNWSAAVWWESTGSPMCPVFWVWMQRSHERTSFNTNHSYKYSSPSLAQMGNVQVCVLHWGTRQGLGGESAKAALGVVRWPVCWKPGARALGLTGIENEPWASRPGVSLEPALKQLASHLVRLRLAGKNANSVWHTNG